MWSGTEAGRSTEQVKLRLRPEDALRIRVSARDARVDLSTYVALLLDDPERAAAARIPTSEFPLADVSRLAGILGLLPEEVRRSRGELGRAFGLLKHLFEMPLTASNAERHAFASPMPRAMRGRRSRTSTRPSIGSWTSLPRSAKTLPSRPGASRGRDGGRNDSRDDRATMIAKLAPKRRAGRGSFGALKSYLEVDANDRERDDLVASWSGGVASHGTAALEMEAVAQQARAEGKRRELADPVYHVIVSARPGETIDVEQMKLAVDAVRRSLGADEHQYFAAIHHDTDTDRSHVHVAINKVSLRGRMLDRWQDYAKLARAAEWSEREMGLHVDRHVAWRDKLCERELGIVPDTGPSLGRTEGVAQGSTGKRARRSTGAMRCAARTIRGLPTVIATKLVLSDTNNRIYSRINHESHRYDDYHDGRGAPRTAAHRSGEFFRTTLGGPCGDCHRG